MQGKKKTKGRKDDGNKPRMELISAIALFSLGRLLTVGAHKYADRNWENGFVWTRAVGAIIRHVFKMLLGQIIDPETGEPHSTAIMCEAMFLTHFLKTHPKLNDLPKYKFTSKELEEITSGASKSVLAQFKKKVK